MRVHHHWQDIDPAARGASVAMGNFDGLHLGHQSVIDLARRPGAPLGIVTFEPHPRQVFAPDAAPFRLMNAEARANRLAKIGVDQLYELPFDRTLATLTPDAFARDVLADGLGISHVVVGSDFCFGKGRAAPPPTCARSAKLWALTSPSPPLSRWMGSKSPPPRSGKR
jgi:riboflavin kinase / FMN adenylyltransferase